MAALEVEVDEILVVKVKNFSFLWRWQHCQNVERYRMIVNERPEMPRCWWKAKVSVWPSMASSSCKLDKIIISDHPLPHHHLNFTEACCHHKFPAPIFSTQFFRPKVFFGKSWGQTFLRRAYHSAYASSKLCKFIFYFKKAWVFRYPPPHPQWNFPYLSCYFILLLALNTNTWSWPECLWATIRSSRLTCWVTMTPSRNSAD